MRSVVTIGEILVEIVAQEVGDGFREPLHLRGPFASGAPAIFIDQVAKLGYPSGIVSCVGDDDFGRLNLDRLSDDGVDVKAVEVKAEFATGSAFVRYRAGGSRDFVFNIKNSACGQVRLTPEAIDLLGECRHLHVSGSSVFSASLIDITVRAIEMVKAAGGSVSFDPNIRTEILRDRDTRAALRVVLARCDTYLPSGEELTLLTEATTAEGAIEEILGLGVATIVVKHGAEGAVYYDAEGSLHAPGYRVDEVDPTGAGDCFDATFITCRLQGRTVEESLDCANGSGALAVGVTGPMEGTSTFDRIDSLRSGTRPRPLRRLSWLVSGESDEGARRRLGITSVCSAHPTVVEAALRHAGKEHTKVLIEATCNQVNHEGGYTGLTPAAFRDLVYAIADETDCPRQQIILGGDHLGPNPWRHLGASEAMDQAAEMVAAYVSAGYEKIHLDTSMGCAGEPMHIPEPATAYRAAHLASVAETVSTRAATTLHYVIGTEVPVPGGAADEIGQLEVTRPEALLATIEEHRRAFAAAGVGEAFERVMAVVVRPGVEFDDRKVVVYQPDKATELSAALTRLPGMVFEAHSTDYQPPDSLSRLVRDGFAILKVGPRLTFELREALYSLDEIATALDSTWAERSLRSEMERQMVVDPGYWQSYYRGGPNQQRILRHFSYSDRIRYYWSTAASQEAINRLFGLLNGTKIPEPLVSQFLPKLYDRVASGILRPTPRALVLEAVTDVLRIYGNATRPTLETS